MNGYHGQILEVDLTAGITRDLPITEAFCRKFIGGATLAAALAYDRVKEGVDPLGADNPLIFAVGPFTGTGIPMVSRYAVCGISPLTGQWGEATSGGAFPFRLKDSGYDGIIITGKSDVPVYLSVRDGKAEIRDASSIWGKDCYQTQEMIKKEPGMENTGVACIGVAGERQILYSGIMNDEGRAAARTGMGALMGSKKLKAVAVAGEMKVTLDNRKKLRKLSKSAVKDIRGRMALKVLGEYGTLFYTDMGMTLGDTPARYFTRSVFKAHKVTGDALRKSYAVESYACKGCPIGCGRLIRNFSPEYETVDGPEYETTVGFGPLCMNHDWDSIIKANQLCNIHGIDTISAGVSIAYAMYLYDKGVISREMAGMEINWGDGSAILRLIELIIKQEGIGKLLSRGTLRMARELGRDEDEAAQVKGLEMPMHESRAFHGLGVSYATSPRGACHLKGDFYNVDLGGMILEFDILPGDRMSSENKGVYAAKYQSWKDLFDSLTLCKFSPLNPTQVCDMLSAVTGWNFKPAELLTAGDRSVSLKRAISNKCGVTRADDKLPNLCLEPLTEGATAGKELNLDLMLEEYYTYRDWDLKTGKPSRESLLKLGLNNVATEMYPE